MSIGMGFLFPWESHGNENKTPFLECKWEGMEKTVYGNGNDPSSHWEKNPMDLLLLQSCNRPIQSLLQLLYNSITMTLLHSSVIIHWSVITTFRYGISI